MRSDTHLRERLTEEGFHRIARRINRDTVIREGQVRLGSDAGHVAFDAGSLSQRDSMRGFGMAGFADGIIPGGLSSKRRVRRVARDAAQAPGALPKAAAGGEQQWLVPCVPRVLEISCVPRGRGHTVAIPAHAVHIIARKLPRIRQLGANWIRRVRGGRTVAGFAPDAEFVRNNGVIAGERERSGRMAGKATHDRGGRIEDAIRHAARIAVPGRQTEATESPIPALAHFGVTFRIGAFHERDRLRAGAERPLPGLRRN